MTQPRHVLITGGARRIGAAICRRLADDGWRVAVHTGRSPDTAAGTHGAATMICGDLAKAGQLPDLIAQAAARLGGPLDALINNASLFEVDDLASATPESFDSAMAINLRAPLLLSQAFAAQPGLPAGAAIINIIDQRVLRLNPSFLSYTLSKSALWTLTQVTAQALAPRVRVNAVGPGSVLQSIHQDPAVFAAEAAAVPLAHAVDPAEIAAAVAFLLDSPSITGQMIAVDSGQHLAWRTPDVEVQLS